MRIPFLDLKAQYNTLKPKIDQALKDVINDTSFVKGKYVEEFEKQFAGAYEVKHCIGVGNGTDAIYIVLKMLGIGASDEVLTVANTWISTTETITQAGATPVFVDIEPDYYCIDTSKIEEKITKKTKAIIAVHLFGQPANIKKIKRICDKHKLLLIEDCAQSHFAELDGEQVGTFGVAATFSFYPGKNLGAYGDAGAIITNNGALAKKIRMFSNHGSLIKHEHEMEGINSRLDSIQAAVLSVKLPHVHPWNKKRLENALHYNQLLNDVQEIYCPEIRNGAKHVFHLYVVRAQKRSELQSFLKKNNIETQIHYPVPLPFVKAYRHLKYSAKDFPVAYRYQSQLLSLPMYPELKKSEIEYIVLKIKEFYAKA